MGFLKKFFGGEPLRICAPVSGEAVSIKEVSDLTFGEEILGKGVAFRPTEGRVVAPCDATIDLMFDTGHAVNLVSTAGTEILIHVGLETVGLKGKHFTVHAKSGETVKKGELLIEFDKDAIAAEGFDTITPMVICNTQDYSNVKPLLGAVVAGETPALELH